MSARLDKLPSSGMFLWWRTGRRDLHQKTLSPSHSSSSPISTLESPEPINNTGADVRTTIAWFSPKDIASGLQLINLVHADQVDGRTILLHRFELRDPLREGLRSECMSDYLVRGVGTGSGKSVSHRCCRVGAKLDRETVSRPCLLLP